MIDPTFKDRYKTQPSDAAIEAGLIATRLEHVMRATKLTPEVRRDVAALLRSMSDGMAHQLVILGCLADQVEKLAP
jgi:hypothetical protein